MSGQPSASPFPDGIRPSTAVTLVQARTAQTQTASAAPASTGPAAATPTVTSTGAAGTYTVTATDTLSGIAARFGVDQTRLAAANGIAGPVFVVRAGQTLTIPVTGGPNSYTVTGTDSLSGIGVRFGVDWMRIAEANGITGPGYLVRAGQTLTIPAARARRPRAGRRTSHRNVPGVHEAPRRRVPYCAGARRCEMAVPERHRVHVIAGGYPPGNPASHDHDYARLRILHGLALHDHTPTTISGDFEDLEKWLPGTEFLVTYTAGPIPTDEQSSFMNDWISAGGRWFALHGTSGGRARRVPESLRPDGRPQRRMLRSGYHDVLGGFFLNHPPLRRFDVDVVDRDHPITRGLPATFETVDEPYMVEVAADARVLLTARLGPDNSPPGFGFVYDKDTALVPDGETRVLGYVRDQGRGAVSYVALGHCHTPTTSTQPFVEENVAAGGVTPPTLRGSWDTVAFSTLLRNAIAWGIAPR